MEDEHVENTVIQPVLRADLSGVPLCGICDRLLEDTQPQIELLCHHSYHTICFFMYGMDTNVCNICNAHLYIPHVMRDDDVSLIRAERKKKKLDELRKKVMPNKELLRDLKLVKKSLRESRGASTKFRTLGRRISREFKEESNNVKELLLSMKRKHKERLLKSEELRDWRKKKARASYYLRMFDLKYRDTPINTLTKLPELKLPNHWSLRGALNIYTWTFERWMRLRI